MDNEMNNLDPKDYKNGELIKPVTTNVNGEPTNIPQPKVIAATVGAGVGSAIGEIGTWIIESSMQIDVPANVEFAIGVVLTAGLAFLAGYFKRPSANIN